MFTKTRRALFCAATLASALAAVPAAFAAPVVQGVIGERIGTSFAGTFSGTAQPGGSQPGVQAYVICIDLEGEFAGAGSFHTYTVLGDSMAPVVHAAASRRAADLYNYAVDRFYDGMVLSETINETGYQFSALMWEIERDFDGLASSLSGDAGTMTAARLGESGDTSAYDAMVGSLRDDYSSIADGYRSARYTVSFLDDHAAGYQSVMMLTPLLAVAEVPEPGTLALAGLGALALLRRKQRAASQPG